MALTLHRGLSRLALGVAMSLCACAGAEPSPFAPTPFSASAPAMDDAAMPGTADDGPNGTADNGGPGDGIPDDDADDGEALGGCCMRHDTPDCNEPEAASCVCGELPQCCTEEWSQLCVEEGVLLGCMQCGGGEEGAEEDAGLDDGGSLGSCCLGSEVAGCAEAEIAACVCAEDPFCCEMIWDDVCASMVQSKGCGECPGGGGEAGSDSDGGGMSDGGMGDGGVDAGDMGDGGMGDGGVDDGGMPTGGPCCTAGDTPGCGNLIIEACVCVEDPFCCFFSWDATCVDEVSSLMCATC